MIARNTRSEASPRSCAVLLSVALSAACAPYVPYTDPGGPAVLQELEPNDSPYDPDFIGGVNSFTHLVIEGHLEAAGGFDVYDHFEFVSDEAASIEFVLTGLSSHADLDLSIWDPDEERIVFTWDAPWNPETGAFTVDYPGKVFTLVIEAYGVDGHYELELTGSPHYLPAQDDEGAALQPLGSDSATEGVSEGISITGRTVAPFKQRHTPPQAPQPEAP